MPDKLPAHPTLTDVIHALGRIDERINQVNDRLASNDRLRNLALFVAALCLLVAGFSVGYARNSGDEAAVARKALGEQIHTNRVYSCASARNVALAVREPSISAAGVPEPTGHFIERMLAQRASLQGVVNLRCGSLPGFATFPYLRAHALHEIEVVLHETAPRRFSPARPEHRPTSSSRAARGHGSNSPTAAVPSVPQSTATKVSPAASHHGVAHPAPSHTEGGGHPHTGSPGSGETPAKATPPVPEPSGPVTAPAESGSTAAPEPVLTPAPELQPESTPPPRTGLTGTVEALGEVVCSVNVLGVRVCAPR